MPNGGSSPEIEERNRKPDACEEQRLHEIFLNIGKVFLESMNEGGAFVVVLFTVFSRDYHEWALRML